MNETFSLIVMYLIMFAIAIFIGVTIRRFIDHLKMRSKSKSDIERLQKIELQKRIDLLEKELAEKRKSDL